jgi:hypothetical protein
MKYVLLLIGFVGLHSFSFGQERFFEFLPGWRSISILESNNSYSSIGLISDGIGSNHYQFGSVSFSGEVLNNWVFDLDTVSNMASVYTNDISSGPYGNLITGTIRGESSDRFYGTFMKFNEGFQDTIQFTTFNILPSNGTQIRTHLALSPNKFILGGFLQNIDFQVYPSLMQVDSLGSIQWQSDFFCGTNCDLYPVHILQASDAGYFFTCAALHNSGGSGDGFAEKTVIIKTDSLGNEQYRIHPGQQDLFAVRGWVLPTDDGNYITAYSDPMIVTENQPQVNANSTIWIKRVDIDGNTIFEFSLIDFLPISEFESRFPYYINQMIETNDGNIVIAGNAGQLYWGFLLKITQEGDPIWIRFVEFPPQAEGNDAGGEYVQVYGVTQTSDNGYIMAGEYFSSPGNIFPEGIQTAIAVKVDEYGCLEPGCQIADAIDEYTLSQLGLEVYPNPATNKINVSVDETIHLDRIRIYNVMGSSILEHATRSNSEKLDVSDLSPGVYLIEVSTKDHLREVKRVVIE